MKKLNDGSHTVEEEVNRIHDVLEGFAEIERGEVVKIARDDLMQEVDSGIRGQPGQGSNLG